jgi:hypothetical protein
MSLSFEYYKTKFINNILFARSQEEVKNLVDEEMKILEQKKDKCTRRSKPYSANDLRIRVI